MTEREVQRGGRERDAVARAHRLDLAHPLEDRGRRRRVLEIGAGDRSGREDAGVVGAADDQRDVAPRAQRQEGIERPLLQQGVAAGKEKAVEVAALGKVLARRGLVDPGADRLDRALVAQRGPSRDSRRS